MRFKEIEAAQSSGMQAVFCDRDPGLLPLAASAKPSTVRQPDSGQRLTLPNCLLATSPSPASLPIPQYIFVNGGAMGKVPDQKSERSCISPEQRKDQQPPPPALPLCTFLRLAFNVVEKAPEERKLPPGRRQVHVQAQRRVPMSQKRTSLKSASSRDTRAACRSKRDTIRKRETLCTLRSVPELAR